MAQARKRRRKKHRGTQAGTIDRRRRRPRTRSEARAMAKQKPARREVKPPTLKGSVTRAAIGTAIFFAFYMVLFKNIKAGLLLAVFAFVIYVPITYWVERFTWKRTQKRVARKAASKEEEQ